MAFIAYEVAVTLTMGVDASFLRFTVFYTLDILLFYINAHVVFQFVFQRRYAVLYLIPLVLAELALFTGATIAVNVMVDSVEAKELDVSKLDYIRAIWRGVYFLGLSTAYWFILRNASNARKANMLQVQKLEGEKRETALENAYLRAQINPHLLFNALNFIYNSVVGISETASRGILLLADVMRYALTNMEPDGKVALCKEVEQVENYIAINQLRFSNKLCIVTDIDSACRTSALRIPPLLLLTFVENMFKHGYLSDPGNPAYITMRCTENIFYFRCGNEKRFNRVDFREGHIGIQNVKTRLQNYYEGLYDLDIADNDVTFTVKLTIRL
ncbi:MAG: histidine kinase [Chitinophagaceae bacterium]|nr:histidine kinase [Chitinophagaceae bacterium]